MSTTPRISPEARLLAKRDDPIESFEAAEHIVPKLGEVQALVLAMVKDLPNRTVPELADELGIADPRRINRRLPELERLGLVERHRGICSRTGRPAARWSATSR